MCQGICQRGGSVDREGEIVGPGDLPKLRSRSHEPTEADFNKGGETNEKSEEVGGTVASIGYSSERPGQRPKATLSDWERANPGGPGRCGPKGLRNRGFGARGGGARVMQVGGQGKETANS